MEARLWQIPLMKYKRTNERKETELKPELPVLSEAENMRPELCGKNDDASTDWVMGRSMETLCAPSGVNMIRILNHSKQILLARQLSRQI